MDKIALWQSDYDSRLEDQSYSAWSEMEVRDFLEKRCGLAKSRPVRGRVVDHHQEAFLVWRDLIKQRELTILFEVVHIDAHSDLGLGDAGYVYLLASLLHYSPLDRMDVDESKLEPGNYLAFALACRWISKLTLVLHPHWGDGDLMWIHCKDYDTESGYLQLERCRRDLDGLDLDKIPVIELEPEVPFEMIPGFEYMNKGDFSFAILSLSPGYTPRSCDSLVTVIREYISES